MDRVPISSTNIISIGYDEPTETQEVEFGSGQIYQYYNVGPQLHEQLMAAPSKGQFLNVYIRNAYPYSRVG